jgi:hypothetical protein
MFRSGSLSAIVMSTMPLSIEYLSRLSEIHQHQKPRTYLEIGVWSGRSLALAGPETLAIGVDPDPQIAESLPPRAKIFCETSDHFFGFRDVNREFEGLPIDLVFVDGLHIFENALRDFANAAKYCAADALIVIHDVLPGDSRMAQRNREAGAWTGDVWKVILAIKKYCPYLRIKTIDTLPTGLSIISGINRIDSTLFDNYDRIVSEFINLDFDYFESQGRAEMNVIADGPGKIERLFAASI